MQIGEWQISADSDELIKDGAVIKLDYKVMQLLLYFTENAGRRLSKSDILKSVWGDEFVSEEVLTVAVSSLRKALGDNPQSPSYIKTIPRFGYQLLSVNSSPPATPRAQNMLEFLEEKVGLRFLIIAAIVILFIVFLMMTSHPHP